MQNSPHQPTGYISALTHLHRWGDNFEKTRTIPVDGTCRLPGLGVTVTFPAGTYAAGTTYARRLTRVAALKSLNDELDDPLRDNNQGGHAYLKANLEGALEVMIVASELADRRIDSPEGQDVVNNGLGVDLTRIGIPIIRDLHLFNRYDCAGSRFDPVWRRKKRRKNGCQRQSLRPGKHGLSGPHGEIAVVTEIKYEEGQSIEGRTGVGLSRSATPGAITRRPARCHSTGTMGSHDRRGTVPQGDGYVEYSFSKDISQGDVAKLRLTLKGSVSGRPMLYDLRFMIV